MSTLYVKKINTLRSYFFQEVSHHALARSLRLESKAAGTAWTLRRENSAQQGVSSLPLHAQIIACSLHSGGEGGSQKQIRESASQFHRMYSASLCTRKLTIEKFLTNNTAVFVPTTEHGVESPHISRVYVTSQDCCTFSPFRTKSHLVYVAHF